MTFSKHLPFLCAIAAGAICLTVRADDADNAAQAAARIAIAKALFAQQTSNAPATWSAPADTNVVMQPVDNKAAEKEAKAKAKADKAAAKAKAKADKEAAEAKAKQDAAQAEADKAAKELADKKAAADAQTAAVQQSAQANADKAAADAAKAADDQKVNAEKAAIAAATMPSTNAEAQAQTTTATATNSTALNYQWMSNGTNVSGATNSWASTPATETKKEKKKKKKEETEQEQAAVAANTAAQQPGTEIGMKPIAAPPLPISASKQDRLAALLQKYQADQITPDEYHSQRAAILAEP
jgi:hypothetical protein